MVFDCVMDSHQHDFDKLPKKTQPTNEFHSFVFGFCLTEEIFATVIFIRPFRKISPLEKYS